MRLEPKFHAFRGSVLVKDRGSFEDLVVSVFIGEVTLEVVNSSLDESYKARLREDLTWKLQSYWV